MKLESLLLFLAAMPALFERGVVALEKMANSPVTGNSPVPQPPDAPEEEEQPKTKAAPKGKAKTPAGPTPEELIQKIMDLVQPAMAKSPEMGAKFVALVQKHGGTRFTDIPAANLPAVLADVEALCEGSVNSAAKLF